MRNKNLYSEMIRELAVKQKKANECISINYDRTNDDFKPVLECLNYQHRMCIALIDDMLVSQSIDYTKDEDLKHVSKLYEVYLTDLAFNEDKARKILINGIVLILLEGYTFDGFFLRKGKKMIHRKSLIN